MGAISREGTFRGVIIDSGVGVSSGGYPQFVANIRATEYFDAQEQEWVDWSEQEEEIMAYLVLFGGNNKPTLSAKQLQKAFGWAGQSFKELNDADYSEVPFQFRIEVNEYQGNVSKQVNWVAEYDAIPGRHVSKLKDTEITKLDKLFAKQLKNFGGVQVASAPEPAGKPNPPETENKIPDAPEIPDKKVANTATDEVDKAQKCTKTEAWRYVIELIEKSAPEKTDEERATLFTDAIQRVAPKAKTKKDITPEQWYQIREKCALEIIAF